MLLYFLRHAEAEDTAVRDFDRRLTEKGDDQAEKVGKFLFHTGCMPDVLLTSPVMRAFQTAQVIGRRLRMKPEEVSWLKCGMTTERLLQELNGYLDKNAILLVGHEPDYSHAVAKLVGMAQPDGIKVRKASLTAIDLPALEAGAGQLQFSIPVRLM